MSQSHHVQERTPGRPQAPGDKGAEIEADQRKGVFRGGGEPLHRDGKLPLKEVHECQFRGSQESTKVCKNVSKWPVTCSRVTPNDLRMPTCSPNTANLKVALYFLCKGNRIQQPKRRSPNETASYWAKRAQYKSWKEARPGGGMLRSKHSSLDGLHAGKAWENEIIVNEQWVTST